MFNFFKKLYRLIKCVDDERFNVHLHLTCDTVHVECAGINGFKISEERSEVSSEPTRCEEDTSASDSEFLEGLFTEVPGGIAAPAVGFGEEVERLPAGIEDDSSQDTKN